MRGTTYHPHATHKAGTWLEPEGLCYPAGGFTRRARVLLRPNPNNPINLPYGKAYIVRASIADTYFSIPARLRHAGKTIQGFISVDTEADMFTFTPNAVSK